MPKRTSTSLTRREQGKSEARPFRSISSPFCDKQCVDWLLDQYLTRDILRDTFVGNYATEYIRQTQLGKWDISKAVSRACKASARTIERLGAQESIPWADEIDR